MHENELPFINGGEPIEWAPEIWTWMSLAVIVVSMVVATMASLAASARERRATETTEECPRAKTLADAPTSRRRCRGFGRCHNPVMGTGTVPAG